MGLPCPVCGGNVDTKLGEIFAHCPYCRAAVAIEDSAVVERYVVASRLGPEDAQRALRRWMHGPDPVAGLAAKCKFSTLPTAPSWVPVWYVRARQSNGQREEATEYLADKHAVPEVVDRLIPPGAMERVRDDETRPELREPTLSLKAALGRELRPKEAQQIALVHVPFYRLTYSYRDKQYNAAVDAVTGEVRVRKFPEKNEVVFFALTLFFFVIYWALNWWSRGLTSDQDVGLAILAYAATFIASVVAALITMAVV